MLSLFTEDDILQIKQQGRNSWNVFELNTDKIIYAIKNNNINKTAFIQLSQNSRDNMTSLHTLFGLPREDITIHAMREAIYLAQCNNPEKDKYIKQMEIDQEVLEEDIDRITITI
jgi:hypothetical protein